MRLRVLLRCGIVGLAAALLTPAQMRFHAKIATEDGSPLPATPQIIPDLSQALLPNCRVITIFGDGSIEYIVDWRGRPYEPATADVCSVSIRLKGYRTTQATFRNNSVVVLKRTGDNEGSMVSMTALKAPEAAQKAFGKGVVAMTERKWAAAQKNFERAVDIYPQYAAAWSDLGEVFKEQSNNQEARSAWEHAIAVDAKYIKPYLQLARLALEQHRMQDAADVAERAIAMNPIEFPSIFFYDAAANFNLKRFDVCEKSVRRAIDLDANHEIPRAEFLLGSVLAAKGDRDGALLHLRKYLQLSPKAPDADDVNRLIARIEAGPEKN